MTATTTRSEYPRPQFERADWINLNGTWEFAFDDERVGDQQKWHLDRQDVFDQSIQVPFTFQSELSGIGDTGFHDLVWYRKSIEVPADWKSKRMILHFGAVDYTATVWINGKWAAFHEGGHTPFQADITELLEADHNEIVLRVEDYSQDVTLPRGKQYWKEDSASIFYTRTTGIWQTVWLEAVEPAHIRKAKFTADIDQNEIKVRLFYSPATMQKELRTRLTITFAGEFVAQDEFVVTHTEHTRSIGLHDFNDHELGHWWSPEKPHLYDIQLELVEQDVVIDSVQSYFGMRKISIENGKLHLNNRPYFLRLVLDQGYFPDGILTAPSDEAFIQDIELTQAMGFNGVRKHQKMEDPRFLYWCDRKGLLVWGEAANAYNYSEEYVRRFTQEWQEVLERDYNHPSIVVWVPMNESWGIPNVKNDQRQQQHGLTLYHLTKSLDDTRPVIYNDGWEMMETDLVAIHDYAWQEEVLDERYASIEKAVHSLPGNREIFVGGATYQGQPILITEFGGIAYKKSEWEGWGYSGADNDEDYLQRLAAVIRPLHRSPIVQGFCYTQLTDVEQEINGLVTYDRKPKVPLEDIRRIVMNLS
ncbi:beta-galactosidase/beta-glucuronidase [Paenibacillus sp. SORGH_AS306]|uniref:glycoside hydrolase family 2 protein n=1 Tax=unclassified Paenibacillus TaxID=185978 RepID=UPI002782EE34|nr:MULTISPECIES: sugar-binding domain-containing protein [unclassified Paenibacillus]MDQ1233252.1 beta-galactosidase/beta-glucuronidase [Paenibacillus sp. SORGH_AS_0306]MDR6110295.1 beta-galactosidase/beta-glucuronidase [Paenibacillus sp. SORGH_AS_0338]